MDFKLRVAEIFAELEEDIDINDALQVVEIPPNPEMGDYAFPCFKFAKKYKKAPPIIAAELKEKIEKLEKFDVFEKVENLGPYVNFFVDKVKFSEVVLKSAYKENDKYGSNNVGEGKKVIVEFSSPNIAKPFHIGHIRSTVIGHSIYKIYKFLGYDTVAINHLGDYGTQFGMLISAYKKWGNKEAIEASPIPELLKLYVRFNEEAEKDESLRDEARYWFKELENNNEEAYELWSWIREVSLKEFNIVYDMFGIKFDSLAGESFYSDKMPEIIDGLISKNLLEDSQGAKIVPLEKYGMTDALVMKKDGSTLYITRDMAAATYRKKEYDFYKNIYVVGAPQKLHFDQWRKILELMGNDWVKDCIHVMFGTVSLEEGTLSTRRGRVVFLEDVLKKAVEKTKEIIEERNPNLENKEEVAKQVGIGAVVFQELFNTRIKDYTFSWERTLSFEGETGPYVQYTYARTCSLLKKADIEIDDSVDFNMLTDKASFNVIKKINEFKDAVISAHDKYEPHIVTRYIVSLAQEFNRFYHDNSILTEENDVKKARLLLVKIVNSVLKTGLSLLTMEAPEQM